MFSSMHPELLKMALLSRYTYIYVQCCILYMIHFFFALIPLKDLCMVHSSFISLKDQALSENSYFATSLLQVHVRFTQIHAEVTYEFLKSKQLRTYSYAVFLFPTNYLNKNHQHSLAAETTKGIWGCIPEA